MGVLAQMTTAFCRHALSRLRRRRATGHLPDPDDIFVAPMSEHDLECWHRAARVINDELDLREEDE